MSDFKRQQRSDLVKQRLEYRKLRRINNAALKAAGSCPGIPCDTCFNQELCRQIAADMDAYRQECDKKCL